MITPRYKQFVEHEPAIAADEISSASDAGMAVVSLKGMPMLARLRGFAGFSMPRPLSINGLAGKVCTTGVCRGRWVWRCAAVAVVATGA